MVVAVAQVACWTTGQQVNLLYLHMGHGSYQNHFISPSCPRPRIAPQCSMVALNTIHSWRWGVGCEMNFVMNHALGAGSIV